MLLLQGEMDSQISAERDFPPLLKSLKSRGSGETMPVLIPKASHNLKQVESASEDGVAGPVAPEVLQKLRAWAKSKL